MFTKTQILAMLKAHGIRLTKAFGQNFLIDLNLLNIIVDLAQVTKETAVIEVGAGAGNLTALLAARAGAVLSFEIDRRLQPILTENLADCLNVELVFSDVLKHDLAPIVAKFEETGFKDIRVVSNLPYSISTPFILTVLREHPQINSLYLTIQLEVAQRFAARPGQKEYGFAALAARMHADFTIHKKLNPACFFPAPEVHSAYVGFTRRRPLAETPDQQKTLALAKIMFTARRKTIKTILLQNGLLDNLALPQREHFLAHPPFDLGRRPETLEIDEISALAKAVNAI